MNNLYLNRAERNNPAALTTEVKSNRAGLTGIGVHQSFGQLLGCCGDRGVNPS